MRRLCTQARPALGAPTQLAAEAADWAAANGMLMRGSQKGSFLPVPMALLPTAWELEAFDTAVELSEPLAKLYRRVAADLPWIRTQLQGAASPILQFLGSVLFKVAAPVQQRSPVVCTVLTSSQYISAAVVCTPAHRQSEQ